MGTEKKSLQMLAAKKLSIVGKYVYQALFYLIEQEQLSKDIQRRINEKAVSFKQFEETIPVEPFYIFLHTPQVSDLISCYLSYCLLMNILRTTEKRTILKEDIYTYLIKSLETDYLELAEEKTIEAIRGYFDSLIEICSRRFDVQIFSSYLVEDGSVDQKYFEAFSKKQFNQGKNPINELSKKMTEMIAEDVIPRNSSFERGKKKYNKGLQQYYQNGFIYLLGEHRFHEFYIPPKLAPAHAGNSYRTYQHLIYFTSDLFALYDYQEQWRNIFCLQDVIYIIGGAGYGKSLFLKNIINNAMKLNIEDAEDYLLIFCDLKSFLADENGKKTLPDFFQESMIKPTGLDDITKDFIHYYLRIGRCIVLLDALDEVPKGERRELHKKVISFFQNNNPNNKICITSRDRGFIPEENIEALEIAPLTPADIEAYIEKMILLKKFKKEDKVRFMEQAQELIDKDFLNNFLILSLLVNIFKSERKLPENKIELYKKCFEYIAKKREEEKSKIGYDWNTIYPLMKDSTFISLSVLAAPNNHDIPRNAIETMLLTQYRTKYKDEATTENAIQEFLEFCSNRTELFVPAAVDDKFRFFHRSFFEYFYSRYIYQQSDVQKMYDLMVSFDVDSEVFELTVALVKEDNEEKYQRLISHIIDEVKKEFESSTSVDIKCTAFGILTLVMQVVDDAYFIKQYYEIIIQYSRQLTYKNISEINQSLICMWTEKNFELEERKNRFIEVYRKPCAQFVLAALSRINTTPIDELFFSQSKNLLIENASKVFGIHFSFEERNLPFYVILCARYSDIHQLMDECVSKGFESIVSTGVEKRRKKAIKKGYDSYLKMSDKTKEAFLQSLVRKKGSHYLPIGNEQLEKN